MKTAVDLQNDSTPSLVLRLAIPAMIAQFVTVLYSIVDRMFVGNIPEVGDTALTTSGFYGVIIDITDDDVIVEFGNNKNCRIPMQKAAIAQVEKADAE